MKKSIFMFIPGLLLLSQIALAQATQDKACGLDYGLSPIGPCAPNADVAKAEMKRLEKNIEEKVEQAVQIYTHRDAAKDNAIDAAKVAAGTMSSFAYNYWKSLQQPEYSRSFSKNNFRVFDKIAEGKAKDTIFIVHPTDASGRILSGSKPVILHSIKGNELSLQAQLLVLKNSRYGAGGALVETLEKIKVPPSKLSLLNPKLLGILGLGGVAERLGMSGYHYFQGDEAVCKDKAMICELPSMTKRILLDGGAGPAHENAVMRAKNLVEGAKAD